MITDYILMEYKTFIKKTEFTRVLLKTYSVFLFMFLCFGMSMHMVSEEGFTSLDPFVSYLKEIGFLIILYAFTSFSTYTPKSELSLQLKVYITILTVLIQNSNLSNDPITTTYFTKKPPNTQELSEYIFNIESPYDIKNYDNFLTSMETHFDKDLVDNLRASANYKEYILLADKLVVSHLNIHKHYSLPFKVYTGLLLGWLLLILL